MKNPEFAGITGNPTLLANSSENVFGAVNQQTRQSLAYPNAMLTLLKEVDCQVSEATKGHLHEEMMVWSIPPATDGSQCVGLGLVWPLTATAGKVKGAFISSL